LAGQLLDRSASCRTPDWSAACAIGEHSEIVSGVREREP